MGPGSQAPPQKIAISLHESQRRLATDQTQESMLHEARSCHWGPLPILDQL